jgi:hypothetical protein
MASPTGRHLTPRLVSVGLVLASVAALAGLGYMLLRALQMVSSGRGHEQFHTFWLVPFTWLGFLIFLAALVAALLVGLLVRFYQLREWRALEKQRAE